MKSADVSEGSPAAARRRTADDRELFENAFDYAPIGMALVSLEGRFMRINDAFCRMVGYERDALLASSFQTITHPDDLTSDLELFGQLKRGEIPSYRLDKRYLRADGAQVWVDLSVSMVRGSDGRPEHFISQVQDLTVRVAQEDALAEATAVAQRAVAAKSEFLANMSHEIRTPLTAVIGFSDLLAQRRGLDAGARDYADLIATAGRTLMAIVNDILDFSKLEAGRYEITAKAVSPTGAARDALTLFALQAHDKGLSLEFAEEGVLPAFVAIDPERLRQVLLNLISNAVKFTDTGAVKVVLRHAAGRLHVRVDDTGRGLDALQQAQLFQRFSQVDASATRRLGGTGLGLAICKGIVEAMGGAISVASRPGEGSSFSFHIAAPAVDAPVPQEEASPNAAAVAGLRVLVVDDNPANRELARVILGGLGATVTEAASGPAAIAATLADSFDLILMDLRMPGMDGLEAARAIRAQSAGQLAAPILAFSADEETSGDGLQAFDGFVRKPLAVASLIEAVAEAVARRPASVVLKAG